MKEIDEIKLIENEAFLDKAIGGIHKTMADLFNLRQEVDAGIHRCEAKLCELVAYKVFLKVGKAS
jgi:hypothetical protein